VARKRPNSEGTVYRLPSGSWCAQVSQGGRRLSKTFPTQREGLAWIHNIRGQINIGMTASSANIKVAQHLIQWLTDTQTTKARSTWKHYKQLVNGYIIPSLGDIRLCDLRSRHIQNFYNQLFDAHVGVYTLRKIHLTLHAALKQAVLNGSINRNPATNAKPPKEPATELGILDENQARQFLVTARSHRWFPLFQLALSTGMRMSEILGAMWHDIDWIKGIIRVERQLMRSNGNGVQFSGLKTKHSRRSIPLSALTLEVLLEHQKRHMIMHQTAGESWQDFDIIFVTKNGTPIMQRNLQREFKKLLSLSGLPDVHFHSLRHSCASMLLHNGIPIHSVSKMLGHSSPSITLNVYSHILPSMESEASKLIDELIMPIQVQLNKSIVT